MYELRANTQVVVPIGPAVAVGDGFTPVTTLAVSSADEAELLKHGSTTVVDISGATFAAITSMDGYFGLTLTTSHTDTEGMLTVGINDDSLILPIKAEFMVLSEAAYDSKYIAKDDGFMDVNIKTVGRADTQETEASNLEAACAAYSATRGLAGTALPAAAADAAGGLPISDAGGLDLDAKIGALTYGTANRVNAQVYGMEAGTVTAAAVATGAIDADAIADNAIDAGAIASDAITAAKIATGAITSTKFAAGAIDAAAIATGAIDADAVASDAVTEIQNGLATASALSSLVTTVGVAGAGLTEAGGDGDHLTAINLPNQTMDIVGNITGNLSGSVGSVTGAVGSVTGAVGSVTGNVGGNVTGSVGSVTGAVGSVTGNVGGNVTGSVGSLATQAKADVNAEVLDVIATDTFAEPSAVPAATSTLKDKINWMFSLLRNKRTQTSSTETLFRDDGSTTTGTSTKSDDGTTLTRGEWT